MVSFKNTQKSRNQDKKRTHKQKRRQNKDFLNKNEENGESNRKTKQPDEDHWHPWSWSFNRRPGGDTNKQGYRRWARRNKTKTQIERRAHKTDRMIV